ncbi:hypothetical protein J6590_071212 [Homalodisca vitripennis]|nr:hypothetical protein J6590_071212 [Homalodisca vitripennis]
MIVCCTFVLNPNLGRNYRRGATVATLVKYVGKLAVVQLGCLHAARICSPCSGQVTQPGWQSPRYLAISPPSTVTSTPVADTSETQGDPSLGELIEITLSQGHHM